MDIYIYIYIYMYIYIYVYYICMCVCIYIYIGAFHKGVGFLLCQTALGVLTDAK